MCLVPPFLATIARSTPELAGRTGQIGTLHQLAIVLGICSSQIIGLLLTGPVGGRSAAIDTHTDVRQKGDKPGAWRYVCLVPGAASLIQIGMAAQSPHGDAKVVPPRRDEEERAGTPTPGGYGASDEGECSLT